MPDFAGELLALDLATKTGFAIGKPADQAPRFGHIVLPSSGDDIGRFAIAFEDWFGEMLRTQRPALVVFEAPILPKVTQPPTVRKLSGLAYDVERQCKRLGIKCREGRASSVKKFFAGSGRAEKADTMQVCRKYGWKVRTDDEADACALWAYSCFKVAPEQAARFAMGPIGAGRLQGAPL